MDAPEKVCLLRLSAIGDTCHVVPLLRTLQSAWPRTRFTWVIGKLEAKLMSLIPDVELITVDKGAGLSAFGRLRTEMQRRGAFDLLLHLQLSIRASATAALHTRAYQAGLRQAARARTAMAVHQSAHRASARASTCWTASWGSPTRSACRASAPRWDIPLPPAALAYAEQLIPPSTKDGQRTLVISACSSHRARNWLPERYAAVADHAVRKHGMRVILCGGPAAIEREMAPAIARHASVPLIDQVGKDTLPQLLALAGARHGAADAGLRPRAHGDHGGNAGHRAVRRHQPRAQRAVSVAPLVRECLRRRGAQVPRQTGGRAAVDAEDRGARRHGAHRSAGRLQQAR